MVSTECATEEVAAPRNLNLHPGVIISLGENNPADGGAHENPLGIAVSS